MMSHSRDTRRRFALLGATLGAAGLATGLVGCSGEARPFEEAVEVQSLGLDALEIQRPVGSLTPLVVNAGERIAFTLAGTDRDGAVVAIPESDRDWRVSDSAVGSIDDNGVFVARADGEVGIDVRIADLVAPRFDVTVSTAVIRSLSAVRGPDTLDPCVAASYTAEGRFTDNSVRGLRDVTWSFDTEEARVQPALDGGVTVHVPRPGTVQLSASVTAAGAGPITLTRPIVVTEALTRIEIRPGVRAAEVGDEQSLTAGGVFIDASGAEGERDITEGVVWSIVAGEAFASVSDTAGSRGLTRALADGLATVRASCADVTAEAAFRALPASGSGTRALAVRGAEDGRLVVRFGEPANNLVTLAVSTGSEYDADDDVTEEATIQLRDAGDDGRAVNLLGGRGSYQLQLLGAGEAVLDILANGVEATLVVEVVL